MNNFNKALWAVFTLVFTELACDQVRSFIFWSEMPGDLEKAAPGLLVVITGVVALILATTSAFRLFRALEVKS